MGAFIKSFFGRKSDFASRVLDRYSANKGVSPFVQSLFKSETAESINARFEKARQEVGK